MNTNTNTNKTYIGAGIILVDMSNAATPRFLCLRGRKTGVWSFPKGHPEDVDVTAPLRTAVRETYEETGFRVVTDYTIVGDSIRYGKRHYWVGIMNPTAARRARILRVDEHSEAGWFTAEEVSALNGNTDVRAWAKKWARQVGLFPKILQFALQSPSSKQPTYLSAQAYSAS